MLSKDEWYRVMKTLLFASAMWSSNFWIRAFPAMPWWGRGLVVLQVLVFGFLALACLCILGCGLWENPHSLPKDARFEVKLTGAIVEVVDQLPLKPYHMKVRDIETGRVFTAHIKDIRLLKGGE